MSGSQPFEGREKYIFLQLGKLGVNAVTEWQKKNIE